VKRKGRRKPAAARRGNAAAPPKDRANLIFLAWSGERSKKIALCLRDTLKLICNGFQPWMSDVDVATGTRWEAEIGEALDQAQAAILCLTPENLNTPWVLFEAGAVAKSRTSLVIPYLFGLSATRDLKPPLSTFQRVTSALDEAQNLKMVRSLHSALPEGERRIGEGDLEEAFGLVWKTKLYPQLQGVGPGPVEPLQKRDDSEVLDEILGLVRGLAQQDQIRRAAEAYVRGLRPGGPPRPSPLVDAILRQFSGKTIGPGLSDEGQSEQPLPAVLLPPPRLEGMGGLSGSQLMKTGEVATGAKKAELKKRPGED
jgi:hypothetical protein